MAIVVGVLGVTGSDVIGSLGAPGAATANMVWCQAVFLVQSRFFRRLRRNVASSFSLLLMTTSFALARSLVCVTISIQARGTGQGSSATGH